MTRDMEGLEHLGACFDLIYGIFPIESLESSHIAEADNTLALG